MELLLIDDDVELTELLAEVLALEGFHCKVCHDGESGLALLQTQRFDLVLLDVMMPKMNGFELLKQLRKSSEQPVLMLTAKGDEIDRVLGLELGADDYLAKPFSERELLARIRAILRRTQKPLIPSVDDEALIHHDIRLYPSKQQAFCGEHALDLTGTELLLLQELLKRPGDIIDKASLHQTILGKRLQPFDRSIDMHLSNLRKKIPERSDGQARIKTVRGKGYIWLQW